MPAWMKNNDGVRIELAPAATEEARSLIGELETILSAEYPPEQRHGLSVHAIFQPHIRFFRETARCGGGLRRRSHLLDFAEIKRMYVQDVARRQGVADAILARIEEEVRGAGLSLLRLETGQRQVAARQFSHEPGSGAVRRSAPMR